MFTKLLKQFKIEYDLYDILISNANNYIPFDARCETFEIH